MDRDGGLTLERAFAAVLGHRAGFAIAFAGALVVTTFAAFQVPPTYRANVIMTIEPGRYPNDFLKPNVIPGLDSRLGSVEKLLSSAPVIGELRRRAGLDKKEGEAPPGIAQAVADVLGVSTDPIESFRKAFTFELVRSQSQRHDEQVVVEMAFKHGDPATAARVVNAAAMRANEENLHFRRAFVEEVVRFLEKSVKRAEEDYRAKEAAWNVFKLKHADRLPEQEAILTTRVAQLRARYTDLKSMERDRENLLEMLTAQRGLLVTQLALAVQVAGAGGDGALGVDPTDLRLERRRLIGDRVAMQRYLRRESFLNTPKHPDVRAAQAELEGIEQQLREVETKLQLMGIPLEPVPTEDGETPAPKEGTPSPPGAPPPAPKPTPTPRKEEAPLTPRPLGGEAKPAVPSTVTPVSGHEPEPVPPAPDPGKLLPPPPPRKPSTPGGTTNRLDGPEPTKPRPGERPRERPPERPGPPVQDALGTERDLPVARAQAMQKLVELLSVARIDERTLEKTVDPTTYRLVVANPAFGQIRGIDLRLGEGREALANLGKDREATFAEIRKVEDALAQMPETRQRLEALTRELADARDSYVRLAAQYDNALKALEVENEGKGEQFRVIEFARPPVRPTGAGRIVFLGLALGASAGVAVLAALLLDRRARAPRPAPGEA